MHRARSFPLLTLALALSVALPSPLGCASAGRDFDTTHAMDVQTGVQDKGQIQAWFGDPYQRQSLSAHPSGCTERWTYTYAYSDRGGARTQTKTLVVDFDAEGTVCDHAYIQQ